jgi:hypothetical protein
MALSTLARPAGLSSGGSFQQIRFPWLHSRDWDLWLLILSAGLCVAPYSSFLLFGGNDSARQLVNGLVTLLIAGPHTYATFNRTVLDADFRRRRRLLVASSILIPIGVTTLIITQYVAMLTIFFLLASLHALQQVTYLTDCYTQKAGRPVSLAARAIDYGVVFTSLYPWATYKMMHGAFTIGPVQLWSPLNPGQLLHGQWWIVYAVFAVFYLLLAVFVVKSLVEWRQGVLNVPKTLLIGVTLPLMYFTPLIDNLDTAFQGINLWHSFQYLAITWFVIRRSELAGERPRNSLWVQFKASFAAVIAWARAKVSGQRWRVAPEASTLLWTAAFYTFQVLMMPISGLAFIFAHVFFPDLPYSEQYSYLLVLPILLVHYYHDAFLFSEPAALVDRR